MLRGLGKGITEAAVEYLIRVAEELGLQVFLKDDG